MHTAYTYLLVSRSQKCAGVLDNQSGFMDNQSDYLFDNQSGRLFDNQSASLLDNNVVERSSYHTFGEEEQGHKLYSGLMNDAEHSFPSRRDPATSLQTSSPEEYSGSESDTIPKAFYPALLSFCILNAIFAAFMHHTLLLSRGSRLISAVPEITCIFTMRACRFPQRAYPLFCIIICIGMSLVFLAFPRAPYNIAPRDIFLHTALGCMHGVLCSVVLIFSLLIYNTHKVSDRSFGAKRPPSMGRSRLFPPFGNVYGIAACCCLRLWNRKGNLAVLLFIGIGAFAGSFGASSHAR